MTALSADKRVQSYETGARVLASIGAAANAVWYKGSLIARNASGYGVVASDAANIAVVGIAREGGNNTGGSNGAKEIPIEYGAVYQLEIQSTSITIADIGLTAVVQDDQTVTDAATASNDIPVGRIVDVRGGKAWVEVGRPGWSVAP
jgi:hypothetical protein